MAPDAKRRLISEGILAKVGKRHSFPSPLTMTLVPLTHLVAGVDLTHALLVARAERRLAGLAAEEDLDVVLRRSQKNG